MSLNILDVGNYWFDKKNSNKWFNSSEADDEEITNKFLSYLSISQGEISEYLELSIKEKLSYIILYDQMVRHFYRKENTHLIEIYHQKALFLAEQILSDKINIKSLSPEEKCFLLLPLRHTFSLHYLEIVITKIKEYMKIEDHPMYRRFWRATLISYSQIKTSLINVEPINTDISDEEIFNILDKEHKAANNLTNIFPLNRKNKFYRAFESLFNSVRKEKNSIVISLSGGVDSMVASFVMHHFCKDMGIELIGIHINYGNRETCKLEVELVKRWANLLNIKLYVRHIEHLKRPGGQKGKEEWSQGSSQGLSQESSERFSQGSSERFSQGSSEGKEKKEGSGLSSEDRTLYEEVTRIIRFQMYQKFPNTPVVLGHNLDDCEENMMTNIRKAKCYDNLLGMKKVGSENGVVLLRPMLEISKSEIYNFAYEHEIPHLYDSTPKWSDRGKMRDELIPFLNKFDPAFIPGLFNLTESLINMYKIYSNTVLNDFRKNKIIWTENKILVNSNSPELEYGYQFWKDIIYGILQTVIPKDVVKDKIPSNKSIRFFSDKLSDRHYGKINLNNHLIFDFKKNEIIYICK